MTSILNWISVGEVSAERDQNLQHYFYDAGVSNSLIGNRKHFLLLGRKGAGKTAVFSHLLSKPKGLFGPLDFLVGLSLQSYNWQAHGLLVDSQKAGGFQHRDSWRFALAFEAMRALKEANEDGKLNLTPKIRNAIGVLEKILASPIPSWSDLLGSKLFGLSKIEIPKVGITTDGVQLGGGEISFDEIKRDVTLASALNHNISRLTDFLEDALGTLPAPHRVFLIFDRLDEAWVPTYIEESKSIISGLLHASEDFLTRLDGRIRPIVFLREDIFSTLDINDRNKLKEDCSASLKWTREEIEKLIVSRINFYAAQAGIAKIDALQDVFIEATIRSKTTPVKHAFNRTMCRPRDMVALLGKVISVARDDPALTDGNKFFSKALYDAEPGYSEYLYEELSDEWRNQNPRFIEYLQVIENLRFAVFSTGEFEDALLKKNLVSDRAEFRSVVRFLFDNSIVGIAVGGSTQWRYRCFYPNQGFVDTDVLKIHPGLIKRLGLVERTSPSVVKAVVAEDD